MSSHNRTSILLLSLALFILGASFFWPQLWQLSQNKNAIARVTQIRGQAEKVSIHKAGPETIKKNSIVQNLETIIVGNNSDLTVRFYDGAEIKILSGSLINFSGKPKNPQLNIKKGKLEVISINTTEKLWISENGRTLKAQNYKATHTQDQTLEINPEIKHSDIQTADPSFGGIEGGGIGGKIANATLDVGANKSSSLKNDEQNQIRLMISDRLARQKIRIYRCYSQLLQKKPEAKGKLALHFTVTNLGKVEEAEMTSSQFTDENFHKCLVEVIKRTDFMPFKGNTMATLLPLKFEKTLQ
jgi:hypothetical protein